MPEQYTFPRQLYLNEAAAILKRTQEATDQFWNKMHSLGIYTEEEKEAARLAAIKRTQEELSDLDWNSEDAEGIYRSFASPKDIRTIEIAKGVGTTMATLPFTAGTIGWIPAITSTATGYAGSYGGYKLGQWIDNKYGTNTTPWLTWAGGVAGGIGGYKGLVKVGSAGLLKGSGQMYGKQFTKDVIDDISNQTLNKLKLNGPLRHYSTNIITPYNSNTAKHQFKLYDTLTGQELGTMSTSTFKQNPSTIDDISGFAWARGKGRDLYSAGWSRNPNGLISGEILASPEKTIPTWKHFDHDIVGYYGSHGAAETGGKVVRLKYPERILPEIEPKVIEYVPK